MRARRSTVSWPKLVSLGLALIPLAMLLLIMVMLLRNSALALRALGLAQLFGAHFEGNFTTGKGIYGLLPAMWGTFLCCALALAIAFPASVLMAVLATEFPLGALSKAIGAILGALSGIPPVVYGLMSLIFVQQFMKPKFCGTEIPISLFPPEGMTWYSPGWVPSETSTLLGGFLLALLTIPFMAPLITDAIKNVPHDLREASWGLGANQWYTLKRVILPSAVPGLVSALSLGVLKTMGDVLISAWAIGYASSVPGMASPLWDVLQRVAPLTSTGAGLAGGLSEGLGEARALPISVGYFTGLVLLLMAFAVLGLAAWLQKRLQRRITA